MQESSVGEKVEALRKRAEDRTETKAQIARDFGISRETLYQYLRTESQPASTWWQRSNDVRAVMLIDGLQKMFHRCSRYVRHRAEESLHRVVAKNLEPFLKKCEERC